MITQTHRLDVVPGGVTAVVHVKQYQTGESLVFELFSRFGEFEISSAFTECTVRGTKSDGNGYSANATCDPSNNSVTVELTEQMTAVAGRQPYEITITESTGRMITTTFILDVHRAALDADTVESESVIREVDAVVEDYMNEHGLDYVQYPVYPDSKYGTAGQSLRTKGDGTTEWADVGLPTDEQTQEAVSAWLDEHPEATTTVQDGSITTAKIANNAVTTPKIADGVVSDEKLVNEYADLYSLHLSDTTETGDMTVIVFSNNKVIVCDTGFPDQDDAIDAFMASKSITHVDILITTHFHTDHTGCFEHVANTYCDENTVFYRCMDWDASLIPLPSGGLTVFEYESIISALNATSVAPTQNQVVEPWDYCQLRFLNADPLFLAGYYSEQSDTTTAAYANASLNNLSLITEVTFLGKTILLTGDAEKKAQNNNASFIGHVDVFKVPHHDWNMNGDYSFFANASPDVAFFNRNTAMTYHGGAPHYWDRIKMHMIGEIPTYQTLNEHVIIHITKSSVNAISGYLYSYKGTVSYSDRRIARSIPYCRSNYNFWSYNTWSIDDVLAMISESDYLEDAFVDMNTTSFMTTFVAQIKEMIGTSFTKYRIVPFKNGFELIPTTNAKAKYVFTSGFEYADSSTYSTHFFVASVDEPDVRRVNVNSGSQQINIKDYAETLSQGVHFRFMYNFTGSDFPYTTGNAWVTFYVTTTNNMVIILNPTADNTKMYKLLKQNSTWGNWHVFDGTQV